MTLDQNGEHQRQTIGQVVAALQPLFPDVTHSSLRCLEREGFISSIRTAGGHRLYGPDAVNRIIQIKNWQGQRLSLDQIRVRLDRLERLPDPHELAMEFVELARVGNLNEAGKVISHADEVGLPLETQFGEVLTPALREIGDLWQQGVLPVAREKEISELSRELIVELTRRHATLEPVGQIIITACVEGELHELGVRMITGLLRARGFRVVFLGADVAPRFLLEAVAIYGPAVVLLSAKQLSARGALEETLAALQDFDSSFEVIVGGALSRLEGSMIERYGARIVPDDDMAAALCIVEEALARRAAAADGGR